MDKPPITNTKNRIGIPLLAAAILISSTLLNSCSKEKGLEKIQTTSDKVSGRWQLFEAVGDYTIQGVSYSETTRFGADDYIDFRKDGTVHILANGESFGGGWAIDNEKLYVSGTGYIDNEVGYDIPVLSATELHIHRQVIDGTSTIAQLLKLKR